MREAKRASREAALAALPILIRMLGLSFISKGVHAPLLEKARLRPTLPLHAVSFPSPPFTASSPQEHHGALSCQKWHE